jgi:hypothetical protein
MPKTAKLSDYFTWIANEVLLSGINAPRTIIYCQTIKQCSILYSMLKALLGDNIYVDVHNKNVREVLLEMLHSSTLIQINKIFWNHFKVVMGLFVFWWQLSHLEWVLIAKMLVV